MKKQEMCGCWTALTVPCSIKALADEAREFIETPSLDELDDVKVCFNRLLGALIRRPSVDLFKTPLYDVKIKQRMINHGCIRSERHLVGGRCPQLSITHSLVTGTQS